MATRRPEPPARRLLHLRESGEAIVVALTTILGMLWAIVLVTHFHGALSGVGQAHWLTR